MKRLMKKRKFHSFLQRSDIHGKWPYRAINNVTLRGIVETFDSVTLVEGCERGKRAETAVLGVGP